MLLAFLGLWNLVEKDSLGVVLVPRVTIHYEALIHAGGAVDLGADNSLHDVVGESRLQ
jgi:hypothetical protein